MSMAKTLPKYVKFASDLVTSDSATRDGFREQAIAKAEKAAPVLAVARALQAAMEQVPDIDRLLQVTELRAALAAAAGLSAKSQAHFTSDELASIVDHVFKTSISGSVDFREEILFRYLLTMGDTLGGQMRNWVGANAQRKFSAAILRSLQGHNISHETFSHKISGKLRRISWNNRILLFDSTPKLFRKNIDVVVLESPAPSHSYAALRERPEHYVACGELKGGIDPAGADEHWKTAGSALERIRTVFSPGNLPHLFFIGAAIEPAMADEIFNELTVGRLQYAANLTVPEQVDDLANWLVSL
jgi:hypothetical protein